MDLKSVALNYLKSEHHFTEDEFIQMYSREELKGLYENEQHPDIVKRNIDYFLEDNYYGRMRINWFRRII